jgi:hypothetical protein
MVPTENGLNHEGLGQVLVACAVSARSPPLQSSTDLPAARAPIRWSPLDHVDQIKTKGSGSFLLEIVGVSKHIVRVQLSLQKNNNLKVDTYVCCPRLHWN